MTLFLLLALAPLLHGAAVPNINGADCAGENGPLGFLLSLQHFQQIREIYQEDPKSLDNILLRIAETNPEILDIISENEKEFLCLLNQKPPPSSSSAEIVYLSSADNEVIERLMKMGFGKEKVIEVYLESDKDETLAVNKLLQSMDDQIPNKFGTGLIHLF